MIPPIIKSQNHIHRVSFIVVSTTAPYGSALVSYRVCGIGTVLTHFHFLTVR
jgi:hypothetical protein